MVRIARDELMAWVATWPAPPQDWQLHYQVRQRAYAAGDALHGGEPTLALRHLLAAVGTVVEREERSRVLAKVE
jgi:hypothetical protein